MTAVWRCEPRSHGRNKAATPLPERAPSVAVPHRSASPALRPCGHAASFRRRRRASSSVRRVWSRRCCYWRRCWVSERGACGAQCGARARAAVLWLRLLPRRRVRCNSRDARRACSAMCARGGCVRARAGCKGGGRSVCSSCERGVVLLCGRRACAPPDPMRKMLLMSLQAVAAVAAARSPVVMGACCSRRRRRPVRGSGARRGGGVGVALPVDAVVGRGEDAVFRQPC